MSPRDQKHPELRSTAPGMVSPSLCPLSHCCFLVLMMTTIPTFHFPAPLCFHLGFPGSEHLLHPSPTRMEFRRCLSFYSYIIEHLHSPTLHFLHSQSWKKVSSMIFSKSGKFDAIVGSHHPCLVTKSYRFLLNQLWDLVSPLQLLLITTALVFRWHPPRWFPNFQILSTQIFPSYFPRLVFLSIKPVPDAENMFGFPVAQCMNLQRVVHPQAASCLSAPSTAALTLGHAGLLWMQGPFRPWALAQLSMLPECNILSIWRTSGQPWKPHLDVSHSPRLASPADGEVLSSLLPSHITWLIHLFIGLCSCAPLDLWFLVVQLFLHSTTWTCSISIQLWVF